MTRYRSTKDHAKASRKMHIIKAVCNFPNDDTRRLFVTSLSLGGAFILSLKTAPFWNEFLDDVVSGRRGHAAH